ncbi:MAG TPA: hypothetical protein VMR19_00585 [Candidatus Saccharimonadales bacterium]|jgi:hypothetical protein|nr:hypothetical protein [Candidatus Saccharimonadales bacterium]
MSEDHVENPVSSVQQTRAWATKNVETRFPYLKGDEKTLSIEGETLRNLNKEFITREFLINYLKISENFWRERANQDLSDYEGGIGAESSFRIWNEHFDALNGAFGKGKVSDTIDFFRKEASQARRTAEDIRKELSGEAPVEASKNTALFEHIRLIDINKATQQKAAENFDTAARLFENQTTFVVPTTETEK